MTPHSVPTGQPAGTSSIDPLHAPPTWDGPAVILLLGPTGSGKTRTARQVLATAPRGTSVSASLRDGPQAALEVVLNGLGATHRSYDLERAANGDLPAALSLVESLARAARDATRLAPMTVVLDDLDLAPQWWWAILRLLLERTRSIPWRLLLCARDTWPDARVYESLEPLPEWVRRHRLPALTPADMAEVVAEQTGAIADSSLLRAVADALGAAATTPGVVIDLLRAQRENDHWMFVHGRVYLRDPEIPVVLPADCAYARRTELLDPLARRVYETICATGGLEVEGTPYVADALERPSDEVATAVDDLVRAGLCHHRFGLIGPAVPAAGRLAATTCPPAVRSRLARALLHAIRHGDHAGADPARTADLFVLADGAPFDAAYGTELLGIAQQHGGDDPARAAGWCAALAAVAPSGSEVREQAWAAEIKLRAAAGRWSTCRDLCRRVIDDGTVSVPNLALAFLFMAHALAELGRIEEATERLDEAVRTLPAPLHPALGQQRARVLIATGHFAAARRVLAESGDDIRSDTADWRDAYGAAVLAAISGDVVRFGRILDALAPVETVTAGPEQRAFALDAFAFGDFRAADVTLLAGVAPPTGAWLCYSDARLSLLQGRFEDTDRAACSVPRFTTAGLARGAASGTYAMAAEACLRRGDLDTASDWLDRSDPDLPFGFVTSWVRCGLLMARGMPDEALSLAHGAVTGAQRRGLGAGLPVLALRGLEAAYATGDRVASGLLWDVLTDAEDTPLHRYCALLGRSRRDGLAASAQQAARVAATAGYPFEQARAQTAAAMAGDPADLRAAYRTFDILGAQPDLEHCAAVLRELGLQVPRRAVDPQALSPRDRQISQLVALGYTNGQIGRRLDMPTKTVEACITRLIRLAGARSRVGLAVAWVGGSLAENQASPDSDPDRGDR